jgi:hypothetical protein
MAGIACAESPAAVDIKKRRRLRCDVIVVSSN